MTRLTRGAARTTRGFVYRLFLPYLDAENCKGDLGSAAEATAWVSD